MTEREDYVTYAVAMLAKEKGFDFPMTSFYRTDEAYPVLRGIHTFGIFGNVDHNSSDFRCSAPTQSLLQKWLRKKKGLHIDIVATASGYYWVIGKTNGTGITDSDVTNRGVNNGGCFDTFEECLEDALEYTLKNLVWNGK